MPKKILVFHNGSNYDYHFIIKELAEEFKRQFICLGENTEKYITFTVPIKKEVTRIDKNGDEITKNISYILQFIDSPRFIASSSSNLVNNLSERSHRIKCKFGHNHKKCETCRIKYKYCDCFLEYANFKNDLIEYKCVCCNTNYQHKFDESFLENIMICMFKAMYLRTLEMCLKIYELDPANFFLAPGLKWQAALKKTKITLDLLTDIGMLLMVEKGIRRRICHSIYRYAKTNRKYIDNYDKNKESSYSNIGM